MGALSEAEITTALTSLPEWELGQGELVRRLRFADFPEAVAFVVRLAFEAQVADHHPDIDVRYNQVRLGLSTHSEGGITAKDLALAAAIDHIAGD